MHFENYSNRYSSRIIIDIDYSITHFFFRINESIDFIILCQVSILYDSLILLKIIFTIIYRLNFQNMNILFILFLLFVAINRWIIDQRIIIEVQIYSVFYLSLSLFAQYNSNRFERLRYYAFWKRNIVIKIIDMQLTIYFSIYLSHIYTI